MISRFACFLFFSFLICFPAQAKRSNNFTGKVVAVNDGDTLEILKGRKAIKIRLYGVDCPEKNQSFGQRAKQFTSSFVFGKNVRVEGKEKDTYDRLVAEVFVNDKSLNAALVENGLAWAYRHYTQKFVPLEKQARQAKRGLWQNDNPIPPWEFRKNTPKSFQYWSKHCRYWLRLFRAILKETH